MDDEPVAAYLPVNVRGAKAELDVPGSGRTGHHALDKVAIGNITGHRGLDLGSLNVNGLHGREIIGPVLRNGSDALKWPGREHVKHENVVRGHVAGHDAFYVLSVRSAIVSINESTDVGFIGWSPGSVGDECEKRGQQVRSHLVRHSGHYSAPA